MKPISNFTIAKRTLQIQLKEFSNQKDRRNLKHRGLIRVSKTVYLLLRVGE